MSPPFILLEKSAVNDPWLMDDAANSVMSHSNLSSFFNIMEKRQLTAVFQPVLDMHVGDYFAYEGLIRGPKGSPLESPAVLFQLARDADVTNEFEKLCREVVLESYAALNLSARLFVNVSIPCLSDPDYRRDGDAALLGSLGLSPAKIVIEITENHLVSDFSIFREVLEEYRQLGFEFAMDDLGEGFSNLRMWSEVRPEFVKIDRHFISNIATEPLKFQLVKAMQQIAETCGARLVAEGVETESEFTTVRDLGIRFAQGFLIARPETRPLAAPTAPIGRMLNADRIIVFPNAQRHAGGHTTIVQLVQAQDPVLPDADNDLVYGLFERHPELLALPVVKHGKPLGMINRFSLIDRFARPFRRELYGKKSCRLMMDEHPMIVDHRDSVQDVARAISNHDRSAFSECFIITRDDKYMGIGQTRELMALITDMQIRSARYSNPLTQLPGNVPINEHIERLLTSNTSFVACYADLDSFKPYNDVYGYRQGDEVILLLGKILDEVLAQQDDFLGHIGGDDFMVMFQSHDWEQRCQQALALFDQRVLQLLDPQHVKDGGFSAEDRRGQMVTHLLPSLSLGCVMVEGGMFHSHHDVAGVMAEAKHQAKKIAGSSLFVERRRGPASH